VLLGCGVGLLLWQSGGKVAFMAPKWDTEAKKGLPGGGDRGIGAKNSDEAYSACIEGAQKDQLSGGGSTILHEKSTVSAENLQETCTEKETPKSPARQSTKGTIRAKGEASVSGGDMGTETGSTTEFFPCVVRATMKIFRLEGENGLDRRTNAGDNGR